MVDEEEFREQGGREGVEVREGIKCVALIRNLEWFFEGRCGHDELLGLVLWHLDESVCLLQSSPSPECT